MAEFMGEVAGLPPRRVRVVVNDRPSRPAKDGDGREGFDFHVAEVAARRWCVAPVVGERQDGHLKVSCQRQGV